MSRRCDTWVWEHSDTNGNDRLVLLAIADEANDDGTNSYPSIERIAMKARVNRATVMRSISRLETAGELLVERPEKYGRGRHNTYVVLMGRSRENVAECDLSLDDEKVAERREKVAQRRAQVRPDPKTLRPLDPKSESEASVVSLTLVDKPDEIELLCERLANRMERHHGTGLRPKISTTWHKEMRLLIERGPKDVEPVTPVSVEVVRRAIDFLFDELATPEGNSGRAFCWADVIQSPTKLRKHWRALIAEDRKRKMTTKSRGAQSLDRVMRKMGVEHESTLDADIALMFRGGLNQQQAIEVGSTTKEAN